MVNDISCTDDGVFFLFYFSEFMFCWVCTLCPMSCYAILCSTVCSNFTRCVVFNYVWKFIFQWAYREHTHTHIVCFATVHSGKGVRSLGKINVCFTWIKLNKLKRRQRLNVPQYLRLLHSLSLSLSLLYKNIFTRQHKYHQHHKDHAVAIPM